MLHCAALGSHARWQLLAGGGLQRCGARAAAAAVHLSDLHRIDVLLFEFFNLGHQYGEATLPCKIAGVQGVLQGSLYCPGPMPENIHSAGRHSRVFAALKMYV